jgi:hypothetical protein
MAEQKFPLSLIIRAVDKATGPLRRVNERIQKITAPVRALGTSLSAFSKEAGFPDVIKGFSGVGAAAKNVMGEAWSLTKNFVAMGAVAAVALYGIIRSSVDAGDDLGMMADRVAMGVDEYASLRFAAEQADVSQDQFNTSMEGFIKRLGEMKAGTGSLTALLKKVGPGFLEQMKGAKTTSEAFDLMAAAMESIHDPAKRAALATAAFGKSGLPMVELLKQGNTEITKQRVHFMELQGSQEDFAKNAGALDNAMRETEYAFMGVRNALMGELFPAFTEIATIVRDALISNREPIREWATAFAKELPGHVRDFIAWIQKMRVELAPLVTSIGAVVERLGGLSGVIKIAAVLMAGKFILSVASLAGALLNLGGAILPVVIRAVMLVGPLLSGLATTILPMLGQALYVASGALFTVGEALLTTPVGWFILAIAAIAGAAYLIYKYWDPISAYFKKPLEPDRLSRSGGVAAAEGFFLVTLGRDRVRVHDGMGQDQADR